MVRGRAEEGPGGHPPTRGLRPGGIPATRNPATHSSRLHDRQRPRLCLHDSESFVGAADSLHPRHGGQHIPRRVRTDGNLQEGEIASLARCAVPCRRGSRQHRRGGGTFATGTPSRRKLFCGGNFFAAGTSLRRSPSPANSPRCVSSTAGGGGGAAAECGGRACGSAPASSKCGCPPQSGSRPR